MRAMATHAALRPPAQTPRVVGMASDAAFRVDAAKLDALRASKPWLKE